MKRPPSSFCNMLTEAHQPFDGCPRQRLASSVASYTERGIDITAGLEAEFSLFSKTDDGDYAPCRAGGMFSVAGLNQFAELLHDIVATLEAMGLPVEQLGKEYGPSQFGIYPALQQSIASGGPLPHQQRGYAGACPSARANRVLYAQTLH